MVACWRYSADDISIMGLHCRQTHYKPAIRGNTGDWTTQTVRPKHWSSQFTRIFAQNILTMKLSSATHFRHDETKTGKRQGCEFALVAKVKADNNQNNVLQIAAGGKVQ